MIRTSSGITRSFEDLLKETSVTKAADAPVCGKSQAEAEQWLIAIEMFISAFDDCQRCLKVSAQRIMMPKTHAEAYAIQASNYDLSNFDPNDSEDERRAKILEKRQYEFTWACLSYGLRQRPDLATALQEAPRPNTYPAWLAIKRRITPFIGTKRAENFH